MLNTTRTTLRFLSSIVRRQFPRLFKDNFVEDVLNYKNYSDTLSSSGQPSKHQLSIIKDAGYSIIINLAPYDRVEAPLKNEEYIVAGLGMKYFHIPVDFSNPTMADFKKFVHIMKNESGQKIWVHCAVNARASSFVYRYRCIFLGIDPKTAIWDLREIWEPFGVWKKFVFPKEKEAFDI
jgi:protein tyrosine phosphatase (PTP) superfamily phosphohydrolase (DUF442 family)